MLHDTIAAISTSPGEGGISVIRISGERAFAITEEIFSSDKKGMKKILIDKLHSHTIHFGYILDSKKILDEVLISIFKEPHSYTGENVIEISTHGGAFLAQKILNLILQKGARHAEPGEFTKRAFLNGRLDLSQAEAVADLIKARTDEAHESSIRQLEGSLSALVKQVREDIINFTSLVELELDFAEEDLEFIKKDELKNKITGLISRLKKIIESYITGKVIREGVNLVIAGKPNSGKSSLFNYLLKTNRAIVSEIAGTTRDYIEESIIINGVMFNLVDTAGLRISEDTIESEGIKRSFKKIEEADLVIYLVDVSEDEDQIKENIKYFEEHFDKKKSILVFSKSDLNEKSALSFLRSTILSNRRFVEKQESKHKGVNVSLLKDETIEDLKNAMVEKVRSVEMKTGSEEIILTNLRHKICLENVVGSLNNAVKTIDEEMSGEYISVDLRTALKYLGEITGEITNDMILNNIFNKFCIGK
jgi:tRNA modification GTPase